VQGGALAPDELSTFLSSPYAADAVELRRADDAAKVPGRPVSPLEHWVPMLRDVARASVGSPGESNPPGAG
jgi:predicted HD phosphohydrolase